MKEKQIIDSARKLFNTKGFKKVSMDEIAKEARVTKRTVYAYFSSKEKLFRFFINEEIKNMRKIVEEAEKQDIDYFEKFHQVVYKLLKYKNSRKFLKVIAKEAMTEKNPIIIKSMQEIDKNIQDYILDKINDAVSKGYIEIDNPEITSFLVYKMYLALMFDWNGNKKKLDENVIADTMLKILKNGIRKKD